MKRIAAITIFVWSIGYIGSALASPLTIVDTVEFDSAGIITSAGDTTPATLHDFGGDSANFITGFGDYLWWTHDFAYDYSSVNVISGVLSVALEDVDLSCIKQEYAFGITDSGVLAAGEVDSRIYEYSINASSLIDGSLSVAVFGLSGDFKVVKSTLRVKYDAAPVPEPTTMLLFGTGLAGLAAMSRRRINQ